MILITCDGVAWFKAIEPFNGSFKNLFQWHGQVPVKGLQRVWLIVLGAVLVYQLLLL